MSFTWRQFFELIEKTFEIKRSALSCYLHINKSTISRLYTGKTSQFFLGDNKIYWELFDPTNQNSLATTIYAKKNNDIENLIFETVKQIIEDEHWTDLTKEIKSDNYKNYIMKLIDLARTNSKENVLHDKIETPIKNKKIINSDLTKDISAATLPSVDNGSKISIPTRYRKCLYCRCFKVTENAPKYGTCTLYSKPIDSAHPSCDFFQENEFKIIQAMGQLLR